MGPVLECIPTSIQLPASICCRSTMADESNPFESPLPPFYVDPLGYGNRKFTNCTLLHKMIAEKKLAEIYNDYSSYLTKKALNMSGKYDSWSSCSPLYLLYMFNTGKSEDRLNLAKLMVENGSSLNQYGHMQYARTSINLHLDRLLIRAGLME